MKKLRFLPILFALLIVLSGCSFIEVNAERDGAQIVAKVNDETITKKEVYDYVGYTWDDEVKANDKDTRQYYKEQALEVLISRMVILQKAKEEGYYTFSSDEKKEIEDTVAGYTQSVYDEALEKYKKEAETDTSIDPEKKAQEDVDAYLKNLGYTKDELVKQEEDGKAYTKLQASITDAVELTDDDVQSAYDTELSSQQTSYDTTPAQLISDDLDGKTILYYPNADFVRVRQILIKLPDDTVTEIQQYRTDGNDAEAEALRDSALKEIAAKAAEVLEKAKATGADLEALITEYGEDPGMESRTNGYPVTKDYTGYVEGFTEAAMSLTEIGKPSDLVATDYGYHIMWLTEKPAKGAVAYDSVKDALKETTLADKKDEAWSTAVSGWITGLEDSGKLVRYTKRLAD